jgi:hypothetical protein
VVEFVPGLVVGALPAYLTTLVLALYAGMAWQWAHVFAFADPLGVAVMVLVFAPAHVARSAQHGVGAALHPAVLRWQHFQLQRRADLDLLQ